MKLENLIIEDLNVSFKVILPNMNYKLVENKINNINIELSEQENIILDFLKTHESLRRITVEDLLGVGGSRAGEILNERIKKH